MDTHTPMSMETIMSSTSLARFTSTPICRALSSPTAKALRICACSRMTVPQIKSAPASTAAFWYVLPLREPIVQNVMRWTLSAAKVMTMLIMLETNMEKITPIRMIVFVESERSSL